MSTNFTPASGSADPDPVVGLASSGERRFRLLRLLTGKLRLSGGVSVDLTPCRIFGYQGYKVTAKTLYRCRSLLAILPALALFHVTALVLPRIPVRVDGGYTVGATPTCFNAVATKN